MEITETELRLLIEDAIRKAKDFETANDVVSNPQRLIFRQRRAFSKKLDDLYESVGFKIPMENLTFYPMKPAADISELVKMAYNVKVWADIPVEHRKEAQMLYENFSQLFYQVFYEALREQAGMED